jgi:Asp-tRNA(Asn)/Glu-tRNA(Gln) amidotransferase A subunit family amidase
MNEKDAVVVEFNEEAEKLEVSEVHSVEVDKALQFIEADHIDDTVSQAQATEKSPKRKAHSQTGPKSIAGKNRARWNALKDGSTAKSMVLPFEDEQVYQKHIREVEKALAPTNYVEAQIVREYAEGLWRIIRHEKRGSYEREAILNTITPQMVANMLGLENHYVQAAPHYLTDLKHRISKKAQELAQEVLEQYQHLQKNAKGIANFNMVFKQYELLFRTLDQWAMDKDPQMTPVIGSTNVCLNLPWQQNPKKLLELLETFERQMFFVAFFDEHKPAIRVWMESWFFLQKNEMRRLENLDQLLVKERNQTYNMLEKLLRFRKSNSYLATIPANLSVMQEQRAA